jgi:hypothetical protein
MKAIKLPILLALANSLLATAACAQMPECVLWRNVMAVPQNPITAQFASSKMWRAQDGTETIEEKQGAIARDSLGRTYGEAHITRSRSQDPGVALSPIQRTITLSDTDKRAITVFPLLKTARINTDPTAACKPRSFEGHASLFERMTSAPWFPSNAVLEDLGFKTIDGVVAHGFRQVCLGEKGDGDWAGRPVHIVEIWVSDELAVNVLEVDIQARHNREFRNAFTNFKRAEPEASLFEIPHDYKIEKEP